VLSDCSLLTDNTNRASRLQILLVLSLFFQVCGAVFILVPSVLGGESELVGGLGR